MSVTNTEDQELILKNKIKNFFVSTEGIRNDDFCPVRDVFAVTTDKWSLFVVYHLGYSKTLRFNQLKKRIPKISSRMLSVTLKRLVEHKILNRTVHAEVPPRVEYQLTPFGTKFADKMIDLNEWFLRDYGFDSKC